MSTRYFSSSDSTRSFAFENCPPSSSLFTSGSNEVEGQDHASLQLSQALQQRLVFEEAQAMRRDRDAMDAFLMTQLDQALKLRVLRGLAAGEVNDASLGRGGPQVLQDGAQLRTRTWVRAVAAVVGVAESDSRGYRLG